MSVLKQYKPQTVHDDDDDDDDDDDILVITVKYENNYFVYF